MLSIALTDDHSLLRKGLAQLVQSLGYSVAYEADNGADFISKIKHSSIPDLVLMDINMPEMDGYQTTQWLKENHPDVPVLALSMYDTESSIIKMLKCGARGYILKDSEPAELKTAIESILSKGYYFNELVSGKLLHAINTDDAPGSTVHQLNERETMFLKYACTEMTYKEIADKMFLSPRTIDGYRDALFEKLNLKTRVGLVMYAIKNGIVIV